MTDPLLHTWNLNLGYANRLVADIPDDKMAVQPAPGMNHAAWVLGHLAFTADMLGAMIGVKPVCPADWAARFDWNSSPSNNASQYPSKATLRKVLEDAHATIAAALRDFPQSRWQETTPLEVVVVQGGLVNIVVVSLQAGRFHAPDDRVPAVEVEDFHGYEASFSAIAARHRGQYHGAGVFTGLGLRFRHFAQRYLLPFTAVLGLSRLPVRGMFLGIGLGRQSPSACHRASTMSAISRACSSSSSSNSMSSASSARRGIAIHNPHVLRTVSGSCP